MIASRSAVTDLPEGFESFHDGIPDEKAAEIVESMKVEIERLEQVMLDDDPANFRFHSTKQGVTIHVGAQVSCCAASQTRLDMRHRAFVPLQEGSNFCKVRGRGILRSCTVDDIAASMFATDTECQCQRLAMCVQRCTN